MKAGKTRLYWFCASSVLALVVVVLLFRPGHRRNVEAANIPATPNPTQQQSAWAATLRRLRSVPKTPPPAPVDEPLLSAMVGEASGTLSPQARRLLRQSFLALHYVNEAAARHFAIGMPEDLKPADIQHIGMALFISDFNYGARVCPELASLAAAAVCSNAVAALTNDELLALAEQAEETDRKSTGVSRPTTLLDDHYTNAFGTALPPEVAAAYSNILSTVKSFVSYDPMSSDLLNDAIRYVASLAGLESWREETLRLAARKEFYEKMGITSNTFEMPYIDTSDQEIVLTTLPPTEARFYEAQRAFLTDVFSYRFERCYGIANPQLIQALSALTLPASADATWTIVQPPSY